MSLIKNFALLAVVLAVLFSSAADAAVCVVKKSKTEKVGNCDVKFKVSGCVKSVVKWRYKADATHVESGKSAHHRWTKSANSAAEQAVEKLFNENPDLQAECFGYSAMDKSIDLSQSFNDHDSEGWVQEISGDVYSEDDVVSSLPQEEIYW